MQNNLIEIKSDSILFNDMPLMFFTKSNQDISYLGIDDILVKKTDCGYEFVIDAAHESAGVMVPCSGCDLIANQQQVNQKRTNRFYYNLNNYFQNLHNLDKYSTNSIDVPIIHLIKNGTAYSWSSPGECIISNFNYLFEPHINIESSPSESCVIFLDISTNYVINLQRYPIDRKEILINKYTGPSSIKNALLYGSNPRKVPNKSNLILQSARDLQHNLNESGVRSIIIGSLARRLNNIPVDVNDIDLMVSSSEELETAASALGGICDQVSLSEKVGKFLFGNISVDMCFDNYNILPASNFVQTRHGLTFLSIEGLMWLYHMDLFSANINEYTDDFTRHTLDALHSLSKKLSESTEFGIISDVENINDYSHSCYKICQEMRDYAQEYKDIRVNTSFEIRSFRKNDSVIFTLINHGSPSDARIIANYEFTKATWEDISGKTQVVKIEKAEGFNVLYLENISLPGIIRCQV